MLYEDRPSAIPGLYLTVASLLQHAPHAQTRVCLGGKAAQLRPVMADLGDSVEVVTVSLPPPLAGWNVKPHVLRQILDEGFEEAVWLDSDLIVYGDIDARLDVLGSGLVATEDVWYGRGQRSGVRTAAWGMEPGKLLPATVNTALLRVRRDHIGLLETWQNLLASDEYQNAQSLPYDARPVHMVGDQDVLTALLESRGWVHLDIMLLRRGSEIAQCYGSAGFTPWERVRAASRPPMLVHAMGPKPWTVLGGMGSDEGGYWRRTHMQLTPYTALARSCGASVPVPGGLSWADETTLLAELCKKLARENCFLQEMPLAVIQWVYWRARQVTGASLRKFSVGLRK